MVPFHRRIQTQLSSWAWHWNLTGTASIGGTRSPKKTKPEIQAMDTGTF